MVQRRINFQMAVGLAALFCVLFYMAIIWSAVKMDYRAYQNQGTGAQVSMVGTFDKLEHLIELIGNVEREKVLEWVRLR